MQSENVRTLEFPDVGEGCMIVDAEKMRSLPSREEAEKLLVWADSLNPGKWVDHSRNAARAAEKIAAGCGMDGNAAYILGLLHDIGRYEGVTGLRHVYSGCRLMLEKGFHWVARVCVSHSFVDGKFDAYLGTIDCSAEEQEYLKDQLREMEFDDYDKLIQLCDSICLPEGICILEKRLIDVNRRYGVNESTVKKWEIYFGIKDYFDKKCGKNIYNYFYQEVVKNSID